MPQDSRLDLCFPKQSELPSISPRRSKLWRRSRTKHKEIDFGSGLNVVEPEPININSTRIGLDRLEVTAQAKLLKLYKLQAKLNLVPRPQVRRDTTCLEDVVVGDGARGKMCLVM